MRARFRSWWQQIQQHPFIATGVVVFLVFILFIFSAYRFVWDWTGFNSGTSQITITSISKVNYKATVPQPSKSLWDWLQLLIIPLVLAVAALLFNLATTRTEQKIALDKQREDLLQKYLDCMSDLLLKERLRSSVVGAEVRKVARVRTITVLFQLDARRIGYVFAFLRESELMSATSNDNIVSFSEADLRRVNFSNADISEANLSEAHLTQANLYWANLSKTNLRWANLMFANLSHANLDRADLSDAYLFHTDLSHAHNLKWANLSGADLSKANLREAYDITSEELEKQAKSLQGATMPDGSIHD